MVGDFELHNPGGALCNIYEGNSKTRFDRDLVLYAVLEVATQRLGTRGE